MVDKVQLEKKFQPILLGSDFNVYGMARSFHEAYGVKSVAYASVALAPTKYSHIVDVNVIPGFSTDEVFIENMIKIGKELDPSVVYLLIPCGDGYSRLVSKYSEELHHYFVFPSFDHDFHERLEDKVSFYQICEEYHLPYPKTLVISKEMAQQSVELPFDFPIALKPADSIKWLDVKFEGVQKAFTIKTREEFERILEQIYQTSYDADMIAQEFIPGDDSHMRVLNAYVDQNHKVRMMCLGHPLLEDPTPENIGNYMVIMPDYNEKVYQQIQGFLEQIDYVGFANFDMKYDERDGEYKLFEINLRQGRSSFYCTLNSCNLAQAMVEDLVYNQPFTETIYGNGDVVWLGLPKKVFEKYARDNDAKKRALEMIQAGRYGTTVFYDKDKSFMHRLLMKYAYHRYVKLFDTYFAQTKE